MLQQCIPSNVLKIRKMSSQRIAVYMLRQTISHPRIRPQARVLSSSRFCTCQRQTVRDFSSSSRRYDSNSKGRESFGSRLRAALNDTKIQWYPIPVGLGIGLLGLLQFNKIREREKANQREEEEEEGEWANGSNGNGDDGRPKKRPRIRPTGPWLV